MLDVNGLAFKAVVSALCFHAYQQVSYMILQRVSPVTHSIGNCVKRVVVIVASVFVFQNPVTQQNALGARGRRGREEGALCGGGEEPGPGAHAHDLAGRLRL